MKINGEKLNVDFVKMVEVNPCIWDNRSNDYRNKKMVKSAWDKISKQINEPVESLPERWRKIRDALYRSIKRHSLKKGTRKKKPYYLTSHLQFLLPLSMHSTTYEATTVGVADDNKMFEYESEDSKPGPFLDESNNTNEAPESFRIDNELQSTSSMQISDKPAIRNATQEHRNNEQSFEMMDEAESVMSKRRKLNEGEDENDSDMSFFKSLLRDVRKMDDRQNRKFRLRVLQVIDEIFDHISAEESPEQDHPNNSRTLLRTQRQKRKL